MQNEKCTANCALSDSIPIAKRRNPDYAHSFYHLNACRKCGCLIEFREGPEVDRYGTRKGIEVDVSYEYARENYGITKDYIQWAFVNPIEHVKLLNEKIAVLKEKA